MQPRGLWAAHLAILTGALAPPAVRPFMELRLPLLSQVSFALFSLTARRSVDPLTAVHSCACRCDTQTSCPACYCSAILSQSSPYPPAAWCQPWLLHPGCFSCPDCSTHNLLNDGASFLALRGDQGGLSGHGKLCAIPRSLDCRQLPGKQAQTCSAGHFRVRKTEWLHVPCPSLLLPCPGHTHPVAVFSS